LAIAELAGVSFSFTCHSGDVYRGSALLQTKLRRAAFVVAVSRRMLDEYLTREVQADQRAKVQVIRCGVDLGRFCYQLRETPREPHLRILTVARLMPVKGLDYLIDACALLRQRGCSFECRIIGDGPLHARLDARIEALDLRGIVHLDGPRSADEVVAALEHASVFVLPSTRLANGLMEGVPVSLMEAMAMGVPVVATRSGAVPELVEHERTGMLVPPADPDALASAILRLNQDVTLARRLAVEARRFIEAEFNLSTSVSKLETLLDATIRRVGAPASDTALMTETAEAVSGV
jgi:glycosyltransferase involved in cell wall biosynthesis